MEKTDNRSIQNKKKHNDGLDLLRIVAMFGVIWVHLSMYLPISEDNLVFFIWGGHGVQVFFVLSGYFAAISLYEKNDWKDYYKKRILRIIPPYYTIIIILILWNILVRKDVPDIFGLKWLRLFFGLNTILPSNDYEVWNNPYGWWTMSSFIWFYIGAPILMKFITNLKRAVLFVPISLGVWIAWKFMILLIFSNVSGLDNINMLSGASPFASLIYFALGILTFFALKEKKDLFIGVGLIALSIIGILIHRNAWTWAAITSILVMFFYRYQVDFHGKCKYIVQFLGKHSFNIYLVHVLAFEISWEFVSRMFEGNILYILWGGVALINIILLASVLHMVTNCVALICTRRGIK